MVVRLNRQLGHGLLVAWLGAHSGILFAENKPVAPETIAGATTLTAEEVVELILSRPGLVIIDSRKKTEYLKGHIEGAISILNTDMKPEDLSRVAANKNQAILFYCNGIRCKRSSDAASKAAAWGYQNLYWYRGGWDEWMEKRLPVVTDEKK
ncbi:MAG: hypothetical protein QG652_958 [Pseudomonadota bacterium]|nr:hypothetical protein [Pseudomonadota bacterium]